MANLTVFLIFVLGLVIGSFLNSVISRLKTEESILSGASHCPHCKGKLAWRDLIPLASFFILKRRCRYCKKPISWQYPLVELATALAFVLIFYKLQATTYHLVFQWTFVSFLIVIFVYDLKHYLILDKVVFPAAGLAAIYQIWQSNFLNALLGAVLLSSFFALLFFFSKGRWIGAGDVKLGFFLGFLISWPKTLVLFLLAYLGGGLVALVLLAAGSKKLTDRIPFGTFLAVAAFVAMLWGEEITNWYFRLIGLK